MSIEITKLGNRNGFEKLVGKTFNRLYDLRLIVKRNEKSSIVGSDNPASDFFTEDRLEQVEDFNTLRED